MLGSKGRSGFRNAQIFAGGCLLGLVLLIGGLFLQVNLIPIADFELLTWQKNITLQTEVGLRAKVGTVLMGSGLAIFVVGFHFLLLAPPNRGTKTIWSVRVYLRFG